MSDNAVVPNVFIRGAKTLTSTMSIAEFTGKAHKDVLKAADNLLISLTGAKLRRLADGFHEGEYLDAKGEARRCMDLERDSAIMLINRFTGPAALEFQAAYIAEFNRQEEIVAQVQAGARPQLDFTPMVDVIRAMGERQDALMERVLNGQTQMLQAILAARAAPHPNAGKNDNTWNRRAYTRAEPAPKPQAGLPNQTSEGQPGPLSRFRQRAPCHVDIALAPFHQDTAGSPRGSGGGPHIGGLSEQRGAGFGGVHAGLCA